MKLEDEEEASRTVMAREKRRVTAEQVTPSDI